MSYALGEHEILRVWELGLRQHPLDRALTILAIAFPGSSRDELAALSIGQRDTHLLTIREKTFGSHLAGLAQCPTCHDRLEFTLQTTDLHVMANVNSVEHVHHLVVDGYAVSFHVPTSLDLAAIVHYDDPVAARELLVRRCVVQATLDGLAVPTEQLPENIVTTLAAQMEECDPQAEILFALNCSACGYGWSVLFDVVVFLWSEISAQAKRLLREVHALAQAYGWREADILSMSTARRQFYLEMVSS